MVINLPKHKLGVKNFEMEKKNTKNNFCELFREMGK